MKKILSFLVIITLCFTQITWGQVRTVDTTKVYTYSQMETDLYELQEMYPNTVKLNIIGKSEYGRNIYEVKLGTGKPILHINGSHHAREWITTTLTMKMIEELTIAYDNSSDWEGYDVRDLLNKTTISFVPMVNPDGVTLQQSGLKAFPQSVHQDLINMNNGSTDFKRWKANAKGVDLNRQYNANWYSYATPTKPSYSGFKGTAPESAKEVVSLLNLVRNEMPEIVLSYHSSGEILYWKFNQDAARMQRDQVIANYLNKLTGYSLVNSGYGMNDGKGFKDWFVETEKRPGFTLEVSPYAGETHVPLSNFNSIWNENKLVPLYLAQESYKLYYNRMPAEKVTLSTDNVNAMTGQDIKITAKSTAYSDPMYRFWIYDGTEWKIVQNYSSNNEFTWTPDKAGEYKIYVHVKDKNSTADYDGAYSLDYTVKGPKVTQVSATVDKATVDAGENLNITASSEGSNNPVYKFNVLEDGQWKVVQDYSSNNKLTWTPSKVGEYKFSIHAKDANSNEAYQSYYAFNYTVKQPEVTKVSATVDKASVELGGNVTISASSEGSNNPMYRFYVLEDGQWKIVQDYSTSNKLTWTPTKTGEYKFSIHAKDAKSNAAYQSYYAFNYKVTGPKVTNVSATVDKATVEPGENLTISASSQGSNNPMYRFYVLEDGQWKIVQDYGSENKLTWTPTKEGEYKFSIHSRDVNSNEAYQSYYAFNYTVKTSSVTKVNATVDKASVEPGESVTISATSEGSKNPMYKFYVLENGAWKLLKDYSSENKLTWTPSKLGEYKFSIHAKDAKSSAAYQSYYAFNYTVKKSIVTKVNATVDKASVEPGQTVTISATSQGSNNPMYRFYVLENGAWKLLKDYSSDNKLTWTPSKAGEYKFSIHSRDAKSSAAYESYYAFNYTVKQAVPEPEIAKTNTAKIAEQIITVKHTSGSYAKIEAYEKVDGKWKTAFTTTGRTGKNGVTYDKTEGDGKSPAGVFTVSKGFGIANNPGLSYLPYTVLQPNDYWVDDSTSQYYNMWMKGPADGRWNSAEALYEYKDAYKYAMVIDYNTERVPYKGSAIFFHVNTGSATAGCISVDEASLVKIMKWIDQSKARIIIAPESDIMNF